MEPSRIVDCGLYCTLTCIDNVALHILIIIIKIQTADIKPKMKMKIEIENRK